MQIQRRRTKVAGGTRETIVNAAAQIFGERGYAASSVDDVAQLAGVTKATVYYHFSSKEDLYAEVRVVLLVTSIKQATLVVASYNEPVSALVNLIHITIQMTLDRHRKYMFYNEIVPIKESVRKQVGIAQRDYARIIESVVAEGQEQGLIVDGRPRMLVAIVLGAIARTATWYTESGEIGAVEFSRLLGSMQINGLLTPAGRDVLARLE